MRIAFDLDDTLLPLRGRFRTEPPTHLPFRWFTHEALRDGAPTLLQALQQDGHELWVYTSSFRSRWQVSMLFRSYGIALGGIVNGDRHQHEVEERRSLRCLKYPPAFAIELLVDDSTAIAQEGKRLGYSVLVVDPTDDQWHQHVWKRLGK